jgi:hypothetical protein
MQPYVYHTVSVLPPAPVQISSQQVAEYVRNLVASETRSMRTEITSIKASMAEYKKRTNHQLQIAKHVIKQLHDKVKMLTISKKLDDDVSSTVKTKGRTASSCSDELDDMPLSKRMRK